MGEVSRHVWLVGPVQGTRTALLDRARPRGAAAVVPAAAPANTGPAQSAPPTRSTASTLAAEDWADRLRRLGALLLDCRPARGDHVGRAPACAALVRQIVPWMLVNDPAGVRRNNLTVYVLAPDLFARADEDPVPGMLERDMSRGELLRLANGLSELLFAWGGNGAGTVAFEHAESADPIDQALIAELVRLLPPELVRLAVCSTTGRVPEALRVALAAGALRREVPTPTAGCECV
ncbi:MAG TPA: hypothetical protein VFX70_13980 [Mycobacteriales bacterium]|nr:hypothetical protein [Mycobacteriales bacterium]